jgi:hypothetical protein
MNDLVQRLSEGQHPIEVTVRPERTIQAFKECLDRDYVHVKFTATRGGTELGVPVDRTRSDFSGANLEAGTGRLTIVGALTLDFVPVRCVAEIELPSLTGQGHLEPVGDASPAGS